MIQGAVVAVGTPAWGDYESTDDNLRLAEHFAWDDDNVRHVAVCGSFSRASGCRVQLVIATSRGTDESYDSIFDELQARAEVSLEQASQVAFQPDDALTDVRINRLALPALT